jgi:hypothetical protein
VRPCANLRVADRLGMLLKDVTDQAAAIDPDGKDGVGSRTSVRSSAWRRAGFRSRWRGADRGAQRGERSRAGRLVVVRNRRQDRHELAFARGGRRLSRRAPRIRPLKWTWISILPGSRESGKIGVSQVRPRGRPEELRVACVPLPSEPADPPVRHGDRGSRSIGVRASR